MTETNTRIRLATTAIGAALAMSATPLLAQEASPPPDTSVDTPTTLPTTDPLAPEPATQTSVTPETVAAPEAAPAAKASTPARAKATAARKPAASSRPAPSARTEPAAAAAAPAAAATAAEPAAVPPIAEPAPIETAPPPAVEPSAARQMQMNTILPIIGAALVGLLAIIAAAFAIRRRRRIRREEYEDNGIYEAVAPAPAMTIEPTPEPGFVAAPASAPTPGPVHDPIFNKTPANAPTTALPEGFDISRFGPHMQAAYRGPTPDNPSLSLRHRLSKASAMDQRERANRAEPAPAESAAVKVAAATAEVAPAAGGDFLLRGDGTKATVRRAYSE